MLLCLLLWLSPWFSVCRLANWYWGRFNNLFKVTYLRKREVRTWTLIERCQTQALLPTCHAPRTRLPWTIFHRIHELIGEEGQEAASKLPVTSRYCQISPQSTSKQKEEFFPLAPEHSPWERATEAVVKSHFEKNSLATMRVSRYFLSNTRLKWVFSLSFSSFKKQKQKKSQKNPHKTKGLLSKKVSSSGVPLSGLFFPFVASKVVVFLWFPGLFSLLPYTEHTLSSEFVSSRVSNGQASALHAVVGPPVAPVKWMTPRYLKCRTICIIILIDKKSVQSMKGFTCVLTHVYLHCVFVCVRMVFFYWHLQQSRGRSYLASRTSNTAVHCMVTNINHSAACRVEGALQWTCYCSLRAGALNWVAAGVSFSGCIRGSSFLFKKKKERK